MKTAWEWVKKNWKWVALPVGILFWLLGRASKKTEVVLQSEPLAEHESVKAQLEKEGIERLRQADAQRQAERAVIEQRNAAALKEINDATERKAKELQEGDPEKLTAFLKGVGKNVREG